MTICLPQFSSQKFIAAAGGAVLVVSLVAAPAQGAAPALARAEAHAVHLRAIAATQVSGLMNMTRADGVWSADTVATTQTDTPAQDSETGATTILGTLVEVVSNFVTMTLTAPVSLALSPLYIAMFGLAPPDFGAVVNNCRYLACVLLNGLIATSVAGAVVGPLTAFLGSVEKLWSFLTPSAAAAALPRADHPLEAPDITAPATPLTTAVPASSSTAASTAGQATGQLDSLAFGAFLLASPLLAPLWYLAAPITIPLSVFAVRLILTIGTMAAPPVEASVVLGVAAWLGLPLLLPVAGVAQIANIFGNLLSPAVTPAAASTAAVRATDESEHAVQPVRSDTEHVPGWVRAGRQTLRGPVTKPAPAADTTAVAETLEADTLEADTVEADTVEADTVEADTVEADTDTAPSLKGAARDSVRSSSEKPSSTTEERSGSGRR